MGRGENPTSLNTHTDDNNTSGKRRKYISDSSSSSSIATTTAIIITTTTTTSTTTTNTTAYNKNMAELRAKALVEGPVQPCKRLFCKTSPCDVQFVKRRKFLHIV